MTAMLTAAATDPIAEFDPAERDLTDSERPAELPDWFQPLVRSAAYILTLGDGWDSYQGRPIEYLTFVSAMDLLAILGTQEPSLPRPVVVPTSHGGVAFEWSTRHGTVEIEVSAPDRGSLYYESYVTGEEFESEFRVAEVPLRYLRTLFLNQNT